MLSSVCSAETIGDVNGDGKIDLAEALYAQQIAAGQNQTSALGDVNGDGKVDLIEVNHALRITSSSPPPCYSNNPSLCSTSSDCTGAGGYWLNNNTCSSLPLIDNPAPVFDYDADSTSVQTLNNTVVNSYQEIATQLASILNDKNRSIAYLKLFEANLLSPAFGDSVVSLEPKPEMKVPSNAPIGEQKNMILTPQNGQINYSTYVLKSDLNGDSIVDFNDLNILNDAIVTDSYTNNYDVNNDQKIDLKDVVFVTARLLTEIKYYDFYTIDGKKLDIPTRDVTMSKVFSYDGNQSVMVVAKDENMASSFESGLSDLDSVWYKQKYQLNATEEIYSNEENTAVTSQAYRATSNTCVYKDRTNVPPEIAVMKNNILQGVVDKAVNAEPDPYLVGWNFTVKYLYRGDYADQDNGTGDFDDMFNDAIGKISSHFAKEDMGNPGKVRLHTAKQFIYTAGRGIGLSNKVSAADTLFQDSLCSEKGVRIKRKYVAQAYSVLFLSEPIHLLTGDISGSEPFKGKLILHRNGPSPEEKDYDITVTGTSFTKEGLPYGGYGLNAQTECGCLLELSDKFIFDEKTTSVSLSDPTQAMKKVYLTLAILDKNNNKMQGATVKIVSDDCAQNAITEEKASDSSGNVRFEDLDMASYKVFVDGKEQASIQVCNNTNEVVKLKDTLWRLHIDYSAPAFPVSGSATFKKFTIDCDNLVDYGADFLFCGGVENDYYDSRGEGRAEVSYNNISYDSGLTPLTIYDAGIDFNVLLPLGTTWQGGSGVFPGEYAQHAAATVDHCNGNFPSGALELIQSGQVVQWTSSGNGGGAECTFILEPCKDEECSAY